MMYIIIGTSSWTKTYKLWNEVILEIIFFQSNFNKVYMYSTEMMYIGIKAES